MSTSIWFWIAFHVGVFIALAVDLISFKHGDRQLTIGAAARRSLLWVALSLCFCFVVSKMQGPERGLDFLTGYVVEYSLSVDNIFVFVLIFRSFQVPRRTQHRVLVWGIVGALVMRGLMIGLGSALVARFHFVLYLFGAFLIATAVRMFFVKGTQQDFRDTWIMKICRRTLPLSREYHGEHFKVHAEGRWMLTPLALVLIVIETMDLAFAVDSIPAVFAITTDPFIVYTSNICAVLGLRSLYFLLAHFIDRFVYLKIGLAVILAFVGCKMILSGIFHIPNFLSLVVIILILAVTMAISMLATRRQPKSAPPNSDVA